MSASPHDNRIPPLSDDASCLDAALYYAREFGYRVFPVQPEDKTPYANKDVAPGVLLEKGQGGFHLATTGAATITRWWTRWPTALIGVAIEDVCIVDVDPRSGGDVAVAQFCKLHNVDISHTVRAVSASGGPHYYFRDEPGLRRGIGFLPGVDFLASGAGAVIVPPSQRKGGQYQWAPGRAPWECDIAEMPVALRGAIEQSFPTGTAYAYKSRPASYAGAPRSRSVSDPAAYVQAAFYRTIDEVSALKAGQRREGLHRLSFALGQFVGAGYLGRTEARDGLAGAFKRAGHPLDAKAEETIDVGLDDGAAQPIQLIVKERSHSSADQWDQQANVDEKQGTGGTAPEDGAGLFGPADGAGMVTVDVRFLAKLMEEAGATRRLRARYHRMMAIVGDKAMNDGQKMTAIALSAKLPVGSAETTSAPVTVYAETIARDLGSKVTKQKDGKERPTKLGTVTKNLADLVDLGFCKREVVERVKTITIPDKFDDHGNPIKNYITTTSFSYIGCDSLPGQRMDRDKARNVATRAAADRSRPRCPHCYSSKLTPSAHVCLKCGTVSSDVDATRAGQEIVAFSDGQFRHRDTAEIIVPGVPIEGDFASQPPDTGFQYQEEPSLVPESNVEAESNDAIVPGPVALTDEDTGAAPTLPTQYQNPVTTVRPGQGYRNPVSGRTQSTQPLDTGENPLASLTSMVTELDQGEGFQPPEMLQPSTHKKPCAGGCGTLTPHGWECKRCRGRPVDTLHIPDSAARASEAPSWA